MDLPSTLRLSETKISCEGWDGPSDDYVVDGEPHFSDLVNANARCRQGHAA
jgi:hypothetical protein